MKNYIQPGNVLTMPAPTGGVTSGAGVLVNSLFGVAAYGALEGDPVEVNLSGVYELPKIAGAIELGEPLYWNGAALTTVAGSGLPRVGTAAKDAANDDATVRIRLSGETA